MTNRRIIELQEGLRVAHNQVLQAISGISEEEVHQVPAPNEWTVAQLLAHIGEIQDFWMDKALLITREEDPNITRSDVENDVRLAAVTDHSGDSLDELTQNVIEANRKAIELVGTIPLEHLDRWGHRGEANPITVAGVVEYLTHHVEEHAHQITESLRLIAESR